MILKENAELIERLYQDCSQNKNDDPKVLMSLLLILSVFEDTQLFIESCDSPSKDKILEALKNVNMESLKAFTKEFLVS